MDKTIHSWKGMTLTEQSVTLPSGETILHTSLLHPGAVIILPMTQNNEIIFLRQYRPSLQQWLLELPAGTIEANEAPLACAQRELGEETGYHAESWEHIGKLVPAVGFCNEIQHLYIATNLSVTTGFQCDDDEIIEVFTLSPIQVQQKIASGEIFDSKTIACFVKAQLCGHLSL
jgi:ADP-ribose pyrophosphatase